MKSISIVLLAALAAFSEEAVKPPRPPTDAGPVEPKSDPEATQALNNAAKLIQWPASVKGRSHYIVIQNTESSMLTGFELSDWNDALPLLLNCVNLYAVVDQAHAAAEFGVLFKGPDEKIQIRIPKTVITSRQAALANPADEELQNAALLAIVLHCDTARLNKKMQRPVRVGAAATIPEMLAQRGFQLLGDRWILKTDSIEQTFRTGPSADKPGRFLFASFKLKDTHTKTVTDETMDPLRAGMREQLEGLLDPVEIRACLGALNSAFELKQDKRHQKLMTTSGWLTGRKYKCRVHLGHGTSEGLWYNLEVEWQDPDSAEAKAAQLPIGGN